MRMKFLLSALGVLAFLALGAVASGCGSGDDSAATSAETSEAPADTTAAAGAATVSVKMNEFSFVPDELTAKAGATTIEAENVGKMAHELVLAKSDLDPAKLPTNSDGTVDEEALDVVGETGDVEPGETGVVNADLEPGSYVIICNLPGHYAGGMYGSLTVK